MDGKLIMGTKLNTEELSRQLGVSRMPIREALKSLEKMSLAKPVVWMKATSSSK
jgi:DNA-binding GntR family transcriptional regulator